MCKGYPLKINMSVAPSSEDQAKIIAVSTKDFFMPLGRVDAFDEVQTV